MRAALKCLGLLVIALVAVSNALAQSNAPFRLDLVPGSTSTTAGATFNVDVVVSGLEGVSPALALTDYDLDVSYDPLILAGTGITFGTGLGGPLDSLQSSNGTGGGLIDLAEVSFLDYASLRALQDDSFVLATLSFQSLAQGVSSLEFVLGPNFIVDVQTDKSGLPGNAAGANCSVNCVSLGGARVTVAAAAVPEPGTLLLGGIGFAAVALVRRRRMAAPRFAG